MSNPFVGWNGLSEGDRIYHPGREAAGKVLKRLWGEMVKVEAEDGSTFISHAASLMDPEESHA